MSSVWIINQYATHPKKGSMTRHFILGRELANMGHKLTIVSSSGHYFHKERPQKYGAVNSEIVDGVKFIWLKTPSYQQTQKIIRVLAWIIFTVRLIFLSAGKADKPSVIWFSSPSLIPYLGSYFLSWRYNAKIIFEFRDVWPLTLISLGKYSKFNPLIIVHGCIERFALKTCDKCISTLEFGWRRLEEFSMPIQKFFWIPNGVSLDAFDALRNKEARLKNDPNGGNFVFGYAGSIGKANALSTIIEAAQFLGEKNISIVIVGDGSEKKRLQARVKQLKLANIEFRSRVSKYEMPELLAQMDACLLSWQALRLYRFGTSANKFAEYLAAGKPIIQAYSGAGDLVSKYSVGITVPAGDSKAFSKAMIEVSQLGKDHLVQYSKNARALAEEKYDFKQIAIKVSDLLSN